MTASIDRFLSPVNAVPAMTAWPEIDGDISPLLTVEPTPRKWLVHNRLLLGRAAVLTGIGGSSKSTLLYHLALAGVLGRLSWGWRIDTTGTALLLLTEDTADDVHHALAALTEDLSDEERELVGRKLKVFPMAGEDVRLLSIDQGTLFENSRGLGLIERCRQIEDLVFVGLDPALALTEGDEMSQSHQRFLGQYADKLAISTGATVMLVTHATKSSATADELTSHQSRGGGGITDAVRAEYVLRTMTSKESVQYGIGAQGDRKRYVQLTCTKGNKLPHDAFAPLWLERGRNGLLYPAELALAVSEKPETGLTLTEQRILEVLRELSLVATPSRQEWRKAAEERGLLGSSSEDARVSRMKRAVEHLLDAGAIKRGVARGVYVPTYPTETA